MREKTVFGSDTYCTLFDVKVHISMHLYSNRIEDCKIWFKYTCLSHSGVPLCDLHFKKVVPMLIICI